MKVGVAVHKCIHHSSVIIDLARSLPSSLFTVNVPLYSAGKPAGPAHLVGVNR